MILFNNSQCHYSALSQSYTLLPVTGTSSMKYAIDLPEIQSLDAKCVIQAKLNEARVRTKISENDILIVEDTSLTWHKNYPGRLWRTAGDHL